MCPDGLPLWVKKDKCNFQRLSKDAIAFRLEAIASRLEAIHYYFVCVFFSLSLSLSLLFFSYQSKTLQTYFSAGLPALPRPSAGTTFAERALCNGRAVLVTDGALVDVEEVDSSARRCDLRQPVST